MNTKNIIREIILSVLGILIFQNSFCQENFLLGYIISLNSDTIHGFIDYRNWEKNPDEISFRKKLNDNESIYTPIDIKGFSVLDEIYESAIIKTEISPIDASELTYNAELTFKTDTAFLQTIIKGSKCLYYYMKKDRREQFYIKQDSSFELLIYKKYIKKREPIKELESNVLIYENKKYLGQLTVYLNDCPDIQAKLKKTEYSKESMEKLFLFYYNCTSSGTQFHYETVKPYVEIGMLAGLSLTSVKFNGTSNVYLVNTDYNQSGNFSAGLFFDIVRPRNQGKWSICNELIFSSFKVTGSFNDYVDEDEYTITSTKFEYSYLKMNNMVRFKYPVGSLFVYLNAGMSNGYAISGANNKKKEIKFYTTERVETGKALDFTRKYEQGFILGLGTKFKNYSFEIRNERGNGIAKSSKVFDLKSPTNRYYFFLGYRF
jgi:hypothetical protein